MYRIIMGGFLELIIVYAQEVGDAWGHPRRTRDPS